MASIFDLAIMTVSSAPGTTATISLGSAATIGGVSYVTFANAGVTNTTSVDYSIADSVNGGSETGGATYSSTGANPLLLTRTPTISTNGNAAINGSSASIVRISPRATTLNNAALFTAGTVATARLGTGTASSSTALYGDQTYKSQATIAQSGSAADLIAGTVPTARLGSGTAASSTFLTGAQTYAAPSGPMVAKVWVQFSGAGAATTINGSFNSSTVTRNAAGDYTVNFPALADANYGFDCVTGPSSAGVTLNVCACRNAAGGTFVAPTTTALRLSFYATFAGGTPTDPQIASVTIFDT